jgi:hypothetical protein
MMYYYYYYYYCGARIAYSFKLLGLYDVRFMPY